MNIKAIFEYLTQSVSSNFSRWELINLNSLNEYDAQWVEKNKMKRPLSDVDFLNFPVRLPIYFESGIVGFIDCDLKPGVLIGQLECARVDSVVQTVAPLLVGDTHLQLLAFRWVRSIYDSLPNGARDWVGIYWRESFITGRTDSSDLIVGPYIGPLTPHVRIGLDSGLCGLAIRENKTINVPDVRTDSRFLACSPFTRSEVVIPISNSAGQVIAELDIDSNQVGAFDSRLQAELETRCFEFGGSL